MEGPQGCHNTTAISQPVKNWFWKQKRQTQQKKKINPYFDSNYPNVMWVEKKLWSKEAKHVTATRHTNSKQIIQQIFCWNCWQMSFVIYIPNEIILLYISLSFFLELLPIFFFFLSCFFSVWNSFYFAYITFGLRCQGKRIILVKGFLLQSHSLYN